MAHAHIQRLKQEIEKARAQGDTDAEIIAALTTELKKNAVGRKVLSDLLIDGAPGVQGALAKAFASGGNQGVALTEGIPPSGRGSFTHLIGGKSDEIDGQLAKARAPKTAEAAQHAENLRQAKATTEHRGID